MNYTFYHKIILIIVGVFLTYLILDYLNEDSNLNKDFKNYEVIQQGCHSYSGNSSVHIKFKNRIYYIRLSYKECLNYPFGSFILLRYDEKEDMFYTKNSKKSDKARIYITIVILLILFIPSKYIWNKA